MVNVASVRVNHGAPPLLKSGPSPCPPKMPEKLSLSVSVTVPRKLYMFGNKPRPGISRKHQERLEAIELIARGDGRPYAIDAMSGEVRFFDPPVPKPATPDVENADAIREAAAALNHAIATSGLTVSLETQKYNSLSISYDTVLVVSIGKSL